MEYLPTDLPRYVKQTSRTDLGNAVVGTGHVLLFSEDGESLTAKLPDDSFVDVGGGGGGSGVLGAAQVTEYTPARAAFTAPSSFAVSGFDGDYTAWNGSYEVTAATQYKQGMERVYKMSGEDKYLVGFYDEMEIMGNAWGFASSPTVSYVGQCVAAMGGDAPATGSWMNYDRYESMTLTLTATETTYPAQAMVLNGKMVTGTTVSGDIREPALAESATAFSSFDRTSPAPVAGGVYVVPSSGHLGDRIPGGLRGGVNGLVYAIKDGVPVYAGDFTPSAAVSTVTDGGETVLDLSSAQYLAMNLPVSALAGDFTVIIRLKILSMDRIALFAGPSDYMIGVDNINGYWSMWASSTGYSWDILQSDSGDPSDPTNDCGKGSIASAEGVWQKIAYVRSGNTWSLYVDDVLSVTKTRTGTIHSSGGIRLNVWGTGSFTGSVRLGKVLFYDRALTTAEMEER